MDVRNGGPATARVFTQHETWHHERTKEGCYEETVIAMNVETFGLRTIASSTKFVYLKSWLTRKDSARFEALRVTTLVYDQPLELLICTIHQYVHGCSDF